jgi:UDP-sugar transporter A1/2/3
MAVLSMVVISGYSAIYFEAMLKKPGEKITIWERNFQLAFYSMVLLVGLVIAEYTQSDEQSYTMLNGWTFNTWLIAFIQAGGGLLVAATLKYADAVLKTLATSGAIVLSAVLGWLLLGGTLDIFISVGCVSTILAIFNYILDSQEG